MTLPSIDSMTPLMMGVFAFLFGLVGLVALATVIAWIAFPWLVIWRFDRVLAKLEAIRQTIDRRNP